jgi:transcriptional/translational regulatory protein YebC/TACO1
MEAALEAGAEDVVAEDGMVEVQTAPDTFHAVLEAMTAAGFKPEISEMTQRATMETRLEGEDAEKMLKLLDRLEDLDDVQNVFSNADFPDEVLEAHAG